MSYGASAALQMAVFDRLTQDSALAAIVGSNIFDALPEGSLPALYVVIGPEEARVQADASGAGAAHEFAVTIVGNTAGFLVAKQAAVAVSDALLIGSELTLSRGALINIGFLRARARRSDAAREVEMWFRALIDDA